jgi:hypothetical protein
LKPLNLHEALRPVSLGADGACSFALSIARASRAATRVIRIRQKERDAHRGSMAAFIDALTGVPIFVLLELPNRYAGAHLP